MEFLLRLLDDGSGFGGVVFLGGILAVALWEAVLPLRSLGLPFALRWVNNIALAVIDFAVMRWTIGFLTLEAALVAQEHGWGLLRLAGIDGWVALIAGVLWMDLVSYGVHRLSHEIPLLWRIHRIHHSDPDVDVTTARRHHPFEPLVTVPVTALAALAFGAPPVALLLYWVITGLTSLFQHANSAIPGAIERPLRAVLVTPAFHLVHHSARRSETDSNYGQVFPWWDRLFGSYCAEPEGGLLGMTVGLAEFRGPREQYLDRLLLQPFRTVDAPRDTVPENTV